MVFYTIEDGDDEVWAALHRLQGISDSARYYITTAVNNYWPDWLVTAVRRKYKASYQFMLRTTQIYLFLFLWFWYSNFVIL